MADRGIKICDVCNKNLVVGKKGERFAIIKDGDNKIYRHRNCFDKTALKNANRTYRLKEELEDSPNTDLYCNLCHKKIGSVCMLSPDWSAELSFTDLTRYHFKEKHQMLEETTG